MDTPTYNQYCLQSLDASNTFQHSEAWFTENKARNAAIKDFGDISKPKENLIVGKYLFYKGVKGKRGLQRRSTNPAKLVGLFGTSITSNDLCFVYEYETEYKKKTNIKKYIGKMINKTSKSFNIDGYSENENHTYKKITEEDKPEEDKLIEIVNDKTIVQVYLDPLLCLQSALCVSNGYASWAGYPDSTKGRIFLNCLKYWHLNKNKQTDTNREIILNILNMCLVKNKNNIIILSISDYGGNGRVDTTVMKNLTILLSYLIIYQTKDDEPEKSIRPKSNIDVNMKTITYNIKNNLVNQPQT